MKKKLLLMVSILAVSFALTGCKSDEKSVDFDYTADEIAHFAENQCQSYLSMATDKAQYEYYTSDEAIGTAITEEDSEGVKVFSTMEENYGDLVEFTDYEVEENGTNVVVTLFADCKDQDAKVKVTLSSNTAMYNLYMENLKNNGYDEDSAAQYLTENGVYAYKVSETELSADQTKGELMKSAGINTMIGMGTVFIVLIFISFIISLLKYVPLLFDSDKRAAHKAAKAAAKNADTEDKAEVKAEAAKTNQVADIVETSTGKSVMDDSELVAVITAAVNAYSSQTKTYVNYPSNDKLIVRSFRRR